MTSRKSVVTRDDHDATNLPGKLKYYFMERTLLTSPFAKQAHGSIMRIAFPIRSKQLIVCFDFASVDDEVEKGSIAIGCTQIEVNGSATFIFR